MPNLINSLKKEKTDLTLALKEARKNIEVDILKKRISKKNLNQLQTELTSLFYGNQQQATTAYRQLINTQAKNVEAIIAQKIKTLDPTSPTDKNYVLMENESNNRIKKAIAEIDKLRENVRNLVGKNLDIAKFAEINNKLAMAKKKLAAATSHELTVPGFHKGKQVIQDSEVLSNLYYIEALRDAFVTTKALSVQKAGEEFEKALVIAINSMADDQVDSLLGERFGNKLTQRGISSGPVLYESDNMEINFSFNPNIDKQGKMDVLYSYAGEDFARISAKRWSSGSGDLGETSIEAGIQRASGKSIADKYKKAVLDNNTYKNGTYQPTELANIAHDYAKLALKSDIAMGLNQKASNTGGYANVLVVDTGEKIVVKDLAEIVTKSKLSKYNESEIYTNKAYPFRNDSESAYLGKMSSALNKMKVTIYENVN